MTCSVQGCRAARSRIGPLCRNHVARKRRHGHPEQTPVSSLELRPYRAAARAVIARWANHDAIKITAERWERLCEQARASVAMAESGRPFNKMDLRAARALLKIADAAPFDTVLEVAAALVLLRDTEGHRVKGDGAFVIQLARCLRKLGRVDVATYWDRQANRVRGVYRDFPVRAAMLLASRTLDAIGPTAGRIVATVKAAAVREERLEGRYRAALAELH